MPDVSANCGTSVVNLLHFLKIFKHKINDHSCPKYSEIYLNLIGKTKIYSNSKKIR